MVKDEQLILTSTVLLGECVFVLRLICHTIYKNANNIFKKNSRHGVDKQNSKLRAQWDYLDVLWHPYLHSQFWSSIFCFFPESKLQKLRKHLGFLHKGTWNTPLLLRMAITHTVPPMQSSENVVVRIWKQGSGVTGDAWRKSGKVE